MFKVVVVRHVNFLASGNSFTVLSLNIGERGVTVRNSIEFGYLQLVWRQMSLIDVEGYESNATPWWDLSTTLFF